MSQSSSEDIIYDLAIVGGGMFGSAAARYAAAFPGIKVCLIGPNEPTVRNITNI